MNNTVFYDIPRDKDFIAFEAAMNTFDIDMEECNILLEMVEHKKRINERRSDVKVYQESGTADDLEMLYIEAENESNQEKDGIIKTIGTKIQNAISAIINFFKNLFTKKIDDPQTQVDDISPDENTKLEGFKNTLPKVIAIVGAAVTAGAGAWALHKKKFEEATAEDNSNENKPAEKTTKGNLLDKFKGTIDWLAKLLNLNKTIDENDAKITDPEGKSFFATVRTWLSNKTAFIGNLGKSLGNKLGIGHKENPDDTKSEDKPEDKKEEPGKTNEMSADNAQNTENKSVDSANTKEKKETGGTTTNSAESTKLDLTALAGKMNRKNAATANPSNKGKSVNVNSSAEDDTEGTEFMETALDRFMNESLASIL